VANTRCVVKNSRKIQLWNYFDVATVFLWILGKVEKSRFGICCVIATVFLWIQGKVEKSGFGICCDVATVFLWILGKVEKSRFRIRCAIATVFFITILDDS
jgi:uncharacterized membrane protein